MRDFRIEDSPEASGFLKTLRIIVFALAFGVVSFGSVAVIIVLGGEKRQVDFPLVSIIMACMGAGFLVISGLIPSIMVAAQRQQLAKQKDFSPSSLLGVFQTKTIIGATMCEGGAFANLVAAITEHQWWSFGIAGVLLLAVLSRFPTAMQLEDFVRQQSELIELERSNNRN